MLNNKFKSILIILIAFAFSAKAQVALLDSLTLDTMQAFTSLEAGLKDPDKVIKLVLRKHKLKEFPMDIVKFKNLQYLDLGRNNLKALPPELGGLGSLQVLILSRNSIESLPYEIGQLKSLKILNVNQNELSSLPKTIGDLEKLEYLDLWSNNIDDFPDELKKLKLLKVMDLRVILINNANQKKIQSMLPNTKIFFSPDCKCAN